ncbi:hypothetical protein LptCag_0412 [Leptospirillum ferriphilum]|uniref:Uncharacterized protein n=1 Tax=Leptospirillum ferriphilum TaxID=178606 RepID=A0A094YJI8_9BACT|nr:hypothetical protein LptCag_0412 [Leptospirillum ferriphilum]
MQKYVTEDYIGPVHVIIRKTVPKNRSKDLRLGQFLLQALKHPGSFQF